MRNSEHSSDRPPSQPPTEDDSNQLPDSQFDLFISYCRRNLEFIQRFYQDLQKQQRNIWIDWADIPPSVNWRAEIHRGISAADSFIAVLSPEYLASYECRVEYEAALKMNKRLIPIVCENVNPKDTPKNLADLNWIFFRPEDNWDESFAKLAEALDTDLPHVRAHTRLLLRAQEWQNHGKDESFLLRGTDLERAEQWCIEGATKQPEPNTLQLQYIDTSRRTERAQQRSLIRLQRTLLGTMTIAFVIASGLGFFAYRQYQMAAVNEIKTLGAFSEALFKENNIFDALIQSLRASRLLKQATWADAETQQKITDTALQAAYWVMESNRLEGHKDWVAGVEFSPDGQILASTSGDKTVRLWQLNGQPIATLEGHQDGVFFVSFSPNGQQLASASKDGTVRLWQRDGTPGPVLSGHKGAVNSVFFSQDGQSLWSAGEDGTIRKWSIEGKPGVILRQHPKPIYSLAPSPDGTLMASAGEDKVVRLWTINGKVLKQLKGAKDLITQVKFSPDGRTIAAVDIKGKISLWDHRTGKLLRQFFQPDPERADRPLYGLAFSPDGRILATASADKVIDLWRWQDGTFLESLKGHSDMINGVSFAPDRNQLLLASASQDTTLKLWRFDRSILSPLIGHKEPVNAVSFSSDGRKIISGSSDKTLHLWSPNGDLQQILEGHENQIYSVSVSPDGKYFASAGADSYIIIWDWNGKEKQRISTNGIIHRVQFSPNGQWIAAGDTDGRLYVWQVDGTPIAQVKTSSSRLDNLNFSPDSQLLILGTQKGEIQLWSMDRFLKKQLTPVTTFNAHNQQTIRDVAFSPDGQIIASASNDRTIKLWKRDGTFLRSLIGHQGIVLAVRFSPDGKTIASSSDDRSIKLWRLDGRLIASLNGHRSGIYGLDFSPDGQKLVSASDDKRILVWNLQNLQLDSLLDRSCSWLHDYLTTNPKALSNSDSIRDRAFCDDLSRKAVHSGQ
ncbi:MAG: hypothetical protein B0A82_04130 [Alkalinema sp. CACIAM 70d]|nr:MAG: hypothetical protein B0A82_04130 [Alkalinema sp. CACIAM 70d]